LYPYKDGYQLLIIIESSFLIVMTSIKDVIDLNTFKQTLIKNGITDLSEEQIIKLRDQQDKEAEIYFNLWMDSIQNKTNV